MALRSIEFETPNVQAQVFFLFFFHPPAGLQRFFGGEFAVTSINKHDFPFLPSLKSVLRVFNLTSFTKQKPHSQQHFPLSLPNHPSCSLLRSLISLTQLIISWMDVYVSIPHPCFSKVNIPLDWQFVLIFCLGPFIVYFHLFAFLSFVFSLKASMSSFGERHTGTLIFLSSLYYSCRLILCDKLLPVLLSLLQEVDS